MNAQIQGAILSTVGARWTKVAMVIAKVARALGQDLPAGDEGYKAISREIEALVQERRLVAQGNIKNWRFSEVRRAGLQENSRYCPN
jgi:hypothetical protein